MRKSLTRLALFSLIALLAGFVVLPIHAQAGVSRYHIRVGGFLKGAPAESMRMLPSDIRVHRGDILRFTSHGFHTATLIPQGQNVHDWVAANAANIGDPWNFISHDPDEGSRATKFNNQVLFPTRQDCGAPGQPACQFDGTGVLNSGLALGPKLVFRVAVDADPGTTLHALCLIHHRMKISIHVVPASEPTSNQKAIDTQTQATLTRDAARAKVLDERFSRMHDKHRENGHVIWDAYPGVDRRRVSLYGMYPHRLRIKRGQRVEWHFEQLKYEDHTATFPLKRALNVAQNSFQPVCDPDGDGGTQPDNPPDTQDPPFCNDPSQLEFDLAHRFTPPIGGAVHKRGEFDSSGVQGSNVGRQDPYELKFTQTSSDHGFGYLCMIHPFMRGRVIVRHR